MITVNEMQCHILSYVHSNVSQENSASILRVEEYFTVDDKKALHSSETFVSTKLHGVTRRSSMISVPLCLHNHVLLRLISILLFLLIPKSFFKHSHDNLYPNVAGISYFLQWNMPSQFQYPAPITDILNSPLYFFVYKSQLLLPP
jgi:hypothetical protein